MIMLFVGYGLIAIAVAIAALIVLYWSYGYSLTSKGEVQQKGIVFVGSNPTGAAMTLNGQKLAATTNERLQLESGDYSLMLSRSGYRSWKHDISVQGGDVQRYEYARLIPEKLTATPIQTFDAAPQFASQSPSRRWLLMKDASTPNTFTLYDTKNPAKPTMQSVALPAELFTAAEGTQTWKLVEWPSNDQFALLEHTYVVDDVAQREYILFNRNAATESRNLTKELSLNQDEDVSLYDKQYDAYYLYNKQSKILRAVSIDGKALIDQVDHVVAYKTYGTDTLLYVTDLPETGKSVSATVNVVLRQGSERMILRRFPSDSPQFLLDIAQYKNDWFVVVAATNGDGTYIFRDPFDQQLQGNALPKPWRFMSAANPAYIAFSSNAQFIITANKLTGTVYDLDRVAARRLLLPGALDEPQTNVRWVDSHRLGYVTNGTLMIADFDSQNPETVQKMSPKYVPFFSTDYQYVFSLQTTDSAAVRLESTPLTVSTPKTGFFN